MKSAALVLAFALGVSADGLGANSHQHSPRRSGRQEAPVSAYSAAPLGGYEADLDSAASDAIADPLSMLQAAIPGVPGEDYPIYSEVPESGFTCDGQVDGGYYADPEAECQVFHICTADGAGGLAQYSFLCPNGTVFNQNYFICDWWFNFDCSEAESLYSLNDEIAAEREANSGNGAASNPAASYASPENGPIGGYNAPSDVIEDAQAAYGQAARNARTGRGPQQPFSQRNLRQGGRRGGNRRG